VSFIFSFGGDGFGFEPVPCALRNGMPVHMPHSEIGKPACQAESVGIFAAGEYPAVFYLSDSFRNPFFFPLAVMALDLSRFRSALHEECRCTYPTK